MPLSLLLSQGNKHPKPSLSLHGDQEVPSPTTYPLFLLGEGHTTSMSRGERYDELILSGSIRRGTWPLQLLFMQLMAFVSAYLFSSAAEQGAESRYRKLAII